MSIYEEISKKIDELYERISPHDLGWLEDAKRTFSLFIKFEKLRDFIAALESVKNELEGDATKTQDLKEVRRLIEELQKNEPNFLIENLKRKGYSLALENEGLRNAINKEALRILEQVRLGKRDAVIGMLVRNFVVKEVRFPMELVEALKPKYDVNLFKAFMYAFLGGFIQVDKSEGGAGKNE